MFVSFRARRNTLVFLFTDRKTLTGWLTNKKQGDRGDKRKIHVTRQSFDTGGCQGHFLEKNRTSVFRCGLRERVYQISVSFFVWTKAVTQINK